MAIVNQRNDGKYLIFWRGRCRITGREQSFKSALSFFPMTAEAMADWVGRFFRNIDFIEYRPWGEAEDAHRIVYPVPVQHVKVQPKLPDLARPDPRRVSRSLFVPRPPGARPLRGGRSLLKGA